MILRALTLWRPWAASIVHGPKRVENRTWAPFLWMLDRGLWIAIHAGRQWDRAGAEFIAKRWPPNVRPDADIEREDEWPDRLTAQGIVGVARVVRCVRCEALTRKEAVGGWAFGPWCWLLDDVSALPEPVACRGAQGLWVMPEDVHNRVEPFCKLKIPRSRP